MGKRHLPVLVGLSAIALAACGSDSGSGNDSSGGSGNGEPLVVGIAPPASGPLAVFTSAIKNNWQLAADQANAKGGVAGHKVKLVVGKPDGTGPSVIREVKKLALQQKAHFIGGVLSSTENAAVNPTLAGINALMFNSTGKDTPLRGKLCVPNTFNITTSASMDIVAIGAAFDKFPAKKWAIMATDYSSGHDAAEAWTKILKDHGQAPAATLFAPLGTTDFGSQISKLKSSGADGLFTFVVGADAVAFIKQADQFGLFKTIPTRVGQNTVSEPLFKPLGNSALGFYNNIEYVHQQDTGDNTEYAAAYKKKYGDNPYYIGAENYVAAQTLFAGVEKAKSVDPAKVKAALKGATVDTIWGQLKIRPEDNQLMAPSNVAQVVKEPGGQGGLGWKLVSTTPASETSPSPDPACHA